MNKLETAQEYVLQKVRASAECALALSKKITSGEYATEHAPCFCGADDDQEVGAQDRYGIPMRTVICRSCSLVRVNPRMTKEAFTSFYNNEYRTLNFPKYLTCEISSEEEERAALYERQVGKGEDILLKMVEQDIAAPKVVLDFGCHLGGMLQPFKKRFNSELWGIELDETAAAFARENGVNVVSSIDELIAKGVKPDFIIMQDVLEHFTDLNEMRKFGEIMGKDAHLYLFTPGIFRANFHSNKQLAHTFYFCANTLNWAMSELGFYPTYIDEDCYGFFQWRGPRVTSHKPAEWVQYQLDEIEGKIMRKMPPFSGVCKFTKQELYVNMNANFAKKIPDLMELTDTCSGAVAIVNGGPSVEGQASTIRELQKQGVKIMSILRMYPWCVDNGITPDYVVSLDCTDDQAKGFAKKVPGVTYLFASVTNPSFFDIIAGEKAYIFDSRDDRKIQDIRRANGYTTCSVVNGGGSVSICSLSLAFNLGFRDLHVFGLDCMVPSRDKSHAEGIAGKSVPVQHMPIFIDGEEILTSHSFLMFAEQALDMVSVAHQEGVLDSVKFYGESLINKLWDGQFHTEAA